MSWSISTRGIARISNYKEAEQHWADSEPWRNEHHSYRPLDSRRMVHKRLVKQSDGAYACTLFNQAMVTYRLDGDVELTCHNSASSNAFAWCVRPRGCRPVSHQRRMYWAVMTDNGEHFYREGASPLHLEPTASGNWLLTSEPEMTKEWAYDPKKGAAVRKAIKPYADWHALTEKVIGRTFAAPAYAPSPATARNAALYLDKPESFLMLANDVARPEKLRETLYLVEGAHYQTPVPFDRLPRRTA